MYEYDDDELAAETTNGAWRSVDGRFWELPDRRPEAPEPESHRELTRIVMSLLPRAANGDPTLALQAVRALRRRVDELERVAVALAKTSGWSWRDIGDQLGISRAAALRRYR